MMTVRSMAALVGCASLLLTGSAGAANLSTVMAQLTASRGDTFSADLGVSTFYNTGTVKVNVVESTASSSFGLTNGSVASDRFYTFQTINVNTTPPNPNTPNTTTFAVSARNTTTPGAGFVNFANGGIADGFNTTGAGIATRTRQRSSSDVSRQPIGTAQSAAGAPVSDLITLRGAASQFQFVLQENSTITNGTVTNFGPERLTSANLFSPGPPSSGVFSAYRVLTSGGTGVANDAGRYLIVFQEGAGGSRAQVTFAAIVEGIAAPEPASVMMLGTGVLGLIGYAIRRRRMTGMVEVPIVV